MDFEMPSDLKDFREFYRKLGISFVHCKPNSIREEVPKDAMHVIIDKNAGIKYWFSGFGDYIGRTVQKAAGVEELILRGREYTHLVRQNQSAELPQD